MRDLGNGAVVSFRSFRVCAFSRGVDYLGAWNRLNSALLKLNRFPFPKLHLKASFRKPSFFIATFPFPLSIAFMWEQNITHSIASVFRQKGIGGLKGGKKF